MVSFNSVLEVGTLEGNQMKGKGQVTVQSAYPTQIRRQILVQDLYVFILKFLAYKKKSKTCNWFLSL